jgi:hypothetical protein
MVIRLSKPGRTGGLIPKECQSIVFIQMDSRSKSFSIPVQGIDQPDRVVLRCLVHLKVFDLCGSYLQLGKLSRRGLHSHKGSACHDSPQCP